LDGAALAMKARGSGMLATFPARAWVPIADMP